MNIFKATADFEQWLAKRLPIIRRDIALKHLHMAEAVFPFFRATFRTSAWAWCRGISSDVIYGAKLVDRAIRVKDPCVQFRGHWLVRRLAPDCSRIELASLPGERDESRLLYDMGWETANMHFGSPKAIPSVKRDLAARRGKWLHKASKAMFKATLKDWEHWRSDWKKTEKKQR